ncbi:MAG: type II toxin-antitoxin system RelE/ParE family toxin [Planctomyces sp.]|nr:type II toxin-antitoxin system RelE/ParE family toxin [Planctomyces sp.]
MKRSRSKVRLALTRRAIEDLRQIERHSVKEWGRKVADKYLDDVTAALDRISQSPQLLQDNRVGIPGLSFYRIRRHVLVCDYRDNSVIVLTVIHTSMDLPARLLELESRLLTEAQILRARLHGDSSAD